MKEIAKPWLVLVVAAVGWIWLNTNAAVDSSARLAVQASQLYDGASLTVLCIIAVTVALIWVGIQPALESLVQFSKAHSESSAGPDETGEKGS